MIRPISRRAAATLGACTLAAALLGTLIWWAVGNSTSPARPPAPVSHVGVARRACLLAEHTADSRTVDTVWTGMRHASERNHDLIVQRYTLPNGVPPKAYLTTLTQMRCETVVTVGTRLADAVASKTLRGRFVVVTDHNVTAPHTTSLTPTNATSAAIATTIEDPSS